VKKIKDIYTETVRERERMKQQGRKRKGVNGKYKQRLVEITKERKHVSDNQKIKKGQNQRELKGDRKSVRKTE
jgi:hypothetical protein